jgi:hypothetical protein
MAILSGRQPEFYGDFMDAVAIVPDPVFLGDRIPQDGKPHKDSWGVTFVFGVDSPGPHPVAAPETLVIKDIEDWKGAVKPPDLDGLDWAEAERLASEVDRDGYFVGCFCPGGLFERSHHLMGFENALVNYMLYEDEMAELLRVIADFKIALIGEVAKHMRPDVIFFHDDWGSKSNVFLPPDLWRRLIKPLHREIVKTAHDHGIMFMHHADCICQPIVHDMVDIGIDIWHGVIPQNDICEIQRATKGKLPMIGGIDGPKIDVENITEAGIRAEVRRAIDTYCPGGRFFPSIPNGWCFREWNQSVYRDELEIYGRQWALENPK